jgi:arsenate reductase (glutaredoxin)
MIEYWHNPRCSKSRAGLALLEEHVADVKVRKYLENGPDLATLVATRAALGNPAVSDMMRTKDATFKELGLGKSDAEDVLLAAMSEHPALIERPIAINGDRARIGRPTEALLDLL